MGRITGKFHWQRKIEKQNQWVAELEVLEIQIQEWREVIEKAPEQKILDKHLKNI